MLNAEPVWKFKSRKRLAQLYGHVHLLKNDVVGQWFCASRHTGDLKWQKQFFRANSICGIENDVIVAYEHRSDGPWASDFGCYGLSLATGEQRWVSHGSGLWGIAGRILDFVPGYTNGFRDSPRFVMDGHVICCSGRVLDIMTGKLVDRKNPAEIQSLEKPKSDAWNLYNSSSFDQAAQKIRVGDLYLSRPNNSVYIRDELSLLAKTENGDQAWEYNIRDSGYHIDGNYYSYRLSNSFIYLVVSEEFPYKPHPSQEHVVLPNPTRWLVLTLDVLTGKIIQEISLGTERVDECQIADLDDDGILIGKANKELIYFSRKE